MAVVEGMGDYITKPFRVDDLLARVRAILRRASFVRSDVALPNYSYRSGGLLINLESMRVSTHLQPVQLTPREWATLRVLIKYVGRIVSSRQILQEAWGSDYGDEGDYVRTYITRIAP